MRLRLTKSCWIHCMVFQKLKWIVKEKPVFNLDTGRVESLRFLIMNTINGYNNTMVHVDISDQIRNRYRFNHWFRNHKWWWLQFFLETVCHACQCLRHLHYYQYHWGDTQKMISYLIINSAKICQRTRKLLIDTTAKIKIQLLQASKIARQNPVYQVFWPVH